MPSEWRAVVRYLLSRMRPLRSLTTCILLPILLLPIPLFIGTREASCAYVVIIMAYFWVTETLPLAVTALIPTFAFPLLSIETASKVSSSYLSDSNFVFFGSMIMAVAVETSKLHERIALRTLLFTGSHPRLLLLGFQLATCFLSMWISNTATTMMMVPIVIAVIKELDLCERKENDPDATLISDDLEEIIDLETVRKEQLKFYKGLLLGICFSASIGGTGTLIGTGPNIVLNSFMQKEQEKGEGPSPLSFASFMVYAIPQMLILLFFCWLWLQFLFIGFKSKKHERGHDETVKRILDKKYHALGPVRYEEKTIMIAFGLMVFMWLTRRPMIFTGWGDLLPPGYATDGTAAMFVALLLFVLPAENPLLPETVEDLKPGEQIRTVMSWRGMREKFSWSTLFLLGGGFAMATGVESSGLSNWMGTRLSGLRELPDWSFIAIACALVTFLTEFSSNVATASIFIPMVASIAKAHHKNPMIFVLPVAFSSSFAFMFPAGTPPNAIVFGVKILHVSDMMLGGAMLNVVSYVVCQLMSHTYAHVIFDFHHSAVPIQNGTWTTSTPSIPTTMI